MTRKKSPSETRRARAGLPATPATAADWSPRPGPPATLDSEPIRPSIPDDKRALDRISQRELGRVEVSLRIPGGAWRPVRLWDFSSIGFGIILDHMEASDDPLLGRLASAPVSGKPMPVQEGDEIELRIRLGAGEAFEVWCKVKNVSDRQGSAKIGLRRLDIGFQVPVAVERRSHDRLPLSPALSLKARIRHPFIFGQWCPVVVADINRQLGFAFHSTDPSILLFEGMDLVIHFELASFRNMPIRARVSWVHADRESEVRFGVECTSMDWRLQVGLCDYLMFSRAWSPSRLRAAGFRTQRVKNHLRFRTVKTMEDYAEVLHLRRDAYVSAGKRPEATTPEEMATALDGMSRILMALHHGQLVGSLTFTFPVTEDTLLDSQAGFPGGKYPVHLPPKANLIEVSRLCIHPEYRGTDLLQGLFETGLKHFLMSDRHWLVTSATPELLPVYERIGFTRLKASYKHHLLSGKEHHLLIAHRSAFLWGFGIGVLTWNSVFGDLVRHLLARKLVPVPAWVRLIIGAKLLFRPLARLVSDSLSQRAFRKHLEAINQGGRRRALRGKDSGDDRENPAAPGPGGGGSLFPDSELEIPESAEKIPGGEPREP